MINLFNIYAKYWWRKKWRWVWTKDTPVVYILYNLCKFQGFLRINLIRYTHNKMKACLVTKSRDFKKRNWFYRTCTVIKLKKCIFLACSNYPTLGKVFKTGLWKKNKFKKKLPKTSIKSGTLSSLASVPFICPNGAHINISL